MREFLGIEFLLAILISIVIALVAIYMPIPRFIINFPSLSGNEIVFMPIALFFGISALVVLGASAMNRNVQK